MISSPSQPKMRSLESIPEIQHMYILLGFDFKGKRIEQEYEF